MPNRSRCSGRSSRTRRFPCVGAGRRLRCSVATGRGKIRASAPGQEHLSLEHFPRVGIRGGSESISGAVDQVVQHSSRVRQSVTRDQRQLGRGRFVHSQSESVARGIVRHIVVDRVGAEFTKPILGFSECRDVFVARWSFRTAPSGIGIHQSSRLVHEGTRARGPDHPGGTDVVPFGGGVVDLFGLVDGRRRVRSTFPGSFVHPTIGAPTPGRPRTIISDLLRRASLDGVSQKARRGRLARLPSIAGSETRPRARSDQPGIRVPPPKVSGEWS